MNAGTVWCRWFAVCLLAWPLFGQAGPWPRLDQGASAPQCQQALALGQAVFQGSSVSTRVLPVVPRGFADQPVIHEVGEHPPDKALFVDPGTFENLVESEDHPDRGIYWQKVPRDGRRLVVKETTHSWRGEVYDLWDVDAVISPGATRAALKADRKPAGMQAVVWSSRWQAPWVFKNKRSGELWMIDAGQSSPFLPEWDVHVRTPGGMYKACTLRFHPAVKQAQQMLPRAIRTLVRLLDQTMGLGHNEGTLNPTRGLRSDVQLALANAAMRPWAEGQAYNSRDEVDAGLLQWAGKGPAYRKHHQALVAQYPQAERALANFYRSRFARSPAQAKALAAYWLDVVVRAHYTFHSETAGAHGPLQNPWQGKVVLPSF